MPATTVSGARALHGGSWRCTGVLEVQVGVVKNKHTLRALRCCVLLLVLLTELTVFLSTGKPEAPRHTITS